ncbi:MAG: N-6 DNA methylase [Opitutaceae bacterium]|nr:N-6 DNA methylase [Opitutaceae bacterium]
MSYPQIKSALGYADSPLFREDDGEGLVAPADQHWVRSAREAGAKGTYFFRTSPEKTSVRPAVHLAEADTVDEARMIHRRLWNQGINPFLIVVLPNQVRVFSAFAYDPTDPDVGSIIDEPFHETTIPQVTVALAAFSADAIDRGEIWQTQAEHLGSDGRVDTTLLANLQGLSSVLQNEHRLPAKTAHGLIGKFVYLSYLRARQILSDKWLQDEAQLDSTAVFSGEVFSSGITLESFRKLSKTVEARFNGKLFPIPWGSRLAPRADAIQKIAQVFSGEEVLSGQLHLPFTAYDFSCIPVEFLSSIYEQFLHAEPAESDAGKSKIAAPGTDAGNPERRGAHYTPEPLADYLISEINSVRPLKAGMKILDPCSGSGVFLVVAYRRLVELECQRRRCRSLAASELKLLLETSIFGAERNLTACQIAGFSLILALLSYVDPPELHRRPNFKFPSLVGNNLFPQDFFDPNGRLWQKIDQNTGAPIKFDWIAGNPPWVELDADDPKAQFVLKWSVSHATEYGLARARTGEAFAWRVMDCLAEKGAVGLILHAKSLTNDHLREWRQKFFTNVHVHRLTNLSNLVYVLFASARQPATTLVYTHRDPKAATMPLLHLGPFVANQYSLSAKNGTKRRAWTVGFSESEIKWVPANDAAKGDASVWKMALWGTARDAQSIQKLGRVFSTKLGKIATDRGWHLGLGLQLRAGAGKKPDPNEYVDALVDLKVLDHLALVRAGPTLTIRSEFLRNNDVGCYVRQGRLSGLHLTSGPRLFLWNDFAAYSDKKFIICHDKLGLSEGTAAEMKAVAAIWNSRYVSYLLFFVTSAAWGIGISQIDKGDAFELPFPELTSERQSKLAEAWEEAAVREREGASFTDVRALLDKRVAAALGIPASVQTVVADFFKTRYQLTQGKSPKELREMPDASELAIYATRLRTELDTFLGGKAHHRISIIHSKKGISVTISPVRQAEKIPVEVKPASGAAATSLNTLLQAAESKFSQWVYVKRSVRMFSGNTIHLIKPPRRLEWSETQAMLDSDDVIAEVLEARSKRTA